MDRLRVIIFPAIILVLSLGVYEVVSIKKISMNLPYGFYKITEFSNKNCTNQSFEDVVGWYSIKNDSRGNMIAYASMVVLKPIQGLPAKLRVSRVADGKEKVLLNLDLTNFCDLFLKELLMMKTTLDQTCTVKPGNYLDMVVDPNKYAKMVVGPKFFYGQYKVMFQAFSNNKRVLCYNAEAKVESRSGNN